jgi:tRNA 2-(methylsulfanyl)-N6-isopentenyladenosine37 hydroxylase
MPELRCRTNPRWVEVVMENFDAFLLDHAACERKASATALNLLAHYPDRAVLVREMVAFAQEELAHFAQVMRVIDARGLILRTDEKDPYVRAMQEQIRHGRESYFLDRLLVAGIVEARGCERFGLLAEALEPGEIKALYTELTRAEARHHGLFVRLAREYFSADEVRERLSALLDAEAAIVGELPLRPAVH